MHRYSLDRFKKAQAAEPFSVKNGETVASVAVQLRDPVILSSINNQLDNQINTISKPTEVEPSLTQITSVGGGQSNWQPPDWAVEPRPGLFWLDVMKDGEVVDKIALEKKRHIFGRQAIMCDFVLDHPSVSRQHAVVLQHKNGSIFVIDMGSVHGTFVANERLSKDSPVELEVGQSLKFAASSRSYVLRKGEVKTPHSSKLPPNFVLPPPPDPSDEEAVVAYNTLLNKLGMTSAIRPGESQNVLTKRPTKKLKKSKVTFRDQYNGILVEVVGISDGADVSMEPGPLGVKEGSLVGRFDDLVEVTVIPKEKNTENSTHSSQIKSSSKGVTEKLQQFLEKVKSPNKVGLYDDSLAAPVGASWATTSVNSESGASVVDDKIKDSKEKSSTFDDDLDDLFGDVGS